MENEKWRMQTLIDALREAAMHHGCSFIRISPFWRKGTPNSPFSILHSHPSPMHLLAEHIWYLPLQEYDAWSEGTGDMKHGTTRSEDDIFKNFRATTRNLIRRAEKEGVTVEASKDPARDLPFFLELHEETRKRHGFTPYTNAFFRSQVEAFGAISGCTLYLARYQGNVVATSIHMHLFGETSYHHGASTQKFGNIPASYLLQWMAIKDALKRGDRIYNFWGIAPEGTKNHPFSGVTTFKTGFGGNLLKLEHCMDIPLSNRYYITRGFEMLRKWRRGF